MSDIDYRFFKFNRLLKVIALVALAFFPCINSYAQVAFSAGGNISTVRNDVMLINKCPDFGYNYGLSVQYPPFQKYQKLSLLNEIIITRKGYRQKIDKIYFVRLNYLSFPVLINYQLLSDVSLQAGVELSFLLFTNVKQGLDTYNRFDWGPSVGLSCFNHKKVGFFARFTYGLNPMLDYYNIDDRGSFIGEIHDLNNVCFSAGIKINIYNEAIHLSKE